VFTNLAHDHLDYHAGPEAYFEAKALLFSGLSEDATAVLNREDPTFARLVERCAGPVLTYGEGPRVDLGFLDLVLDISGTRFRLLVRGEDQGVLSTRLVGRHNVLNLLAAVGALSALGHDPLLAAQAAAAVPAIRGRLERVGGGEDLQAFVDYAHTEDALRAVLGFLREVGAAPIVCVVGCGGDRDRAKRPRMARAAAQLSDRVVLTSDNPRSEDPRAILREMLAGLDDAERKRAEVVADRREAIRRAVLEAPAGATVLVAGKGHEAVQVVGDTTLPFDDVLEVRAALEERSGRAPGSPLSRGPSPRS
jgi:UDP-N-acetylmuramoyl-L-alanyl-D-glutamate--2,6-diaminopimelate ligase